MASETSAISGLRQDGRWKEYAVKVVVLLAVFALVALTAPIMPPILLSVIWALLSIAAAIGAAYHYVVKKVRNRAGLVDGGVVARLNSGRVITMLVAFLVSAACIGGLIFELPKWKVADWVMLIVAVPLYVGIFRLVDKPLAKEFKPYLRTSRTVVASSAILGVVLLVVYLFICFLEPVHYYENMTEALVSVKQPFEHSPSVVLSDLGYFSALADALKDFAMSRLSDGVFVGYLIWRIVLCVSTVFAVSSLIGTCSLKVSELKFVFLPLSAADDPDASVTPVKRYVVWACVLPILAVACFAFADMKAAEVAKTTEYTAIRTAVSEQAGMAACVIDGKLYDYEKVKKLFDEAQSQSASLAEEREKVLTPLINEVFDKRVDNVDAYLDWYYSLPADYERLIQFFAGTIESGMKEQLQQRLEQGIDETELDEKFGDFMKRSEELAEQVKGDLGKYELKVDYDLDSIPTWLIKPVNAPDFKSLSDVIAPTQKFLDAGERMGFSAGIGVASGVIATKVAASVAEKTFFKKIVAALSEKLAVRGLLAEGGTLIAPGVGTAIGLGVGFAADYLFLKADEAMNRESYHDQIVDAINEERGKWLELVKASSD